MPMQESGGNSSPHRIPPAPGDPSERSEQSAPRFGETASSRGIAQSKTSETRRKSKRRPASRSPSPDYVAEAMKPLTDEERQQWKGWVELVRFLRLIRSTLLTLVGIRSSRFWSHLYSSKSA